MAHIDLIVRYTNDIERLWPFYERLGISFVQEKHGSGPVLYAVRSGNLVLEIHHTRKDPSHDRLGISVDNIEDLLASVDATRVLDYAAQDKRALLIDPDGR